MRNQSDPLFASESIETKPIEKKNQLADYGFLTYRIPLLDRCALYGRTQAWSMWETGELRHMTKMRKTERLFSPAPQHSSSLGDRDRVFVGAVQNPTRMMT